MTRTAEEWGRVAVELHGWRWMPGQAAWGSGWVSLVEDGAHDSRSTGSG
jgi:hypothetical protein